MKSQPKYRADMTLADYEEAIERAEGRAKKKDTKKKKELRTKHSDSGVRRHHIGIPTVEDA